MISRKLHIFSLLLLSAAPAQADDALDGRAETNWRHGQERSVMMTEFWVPFTQAEDRVLYGDVRMMGDNQDNREGNLGVGYRQIADVAGVQGVIGAHAWLDRRITARGSTFHQMTLGAEWLGESFDVLANVYVPMTDEKRYEVAPSNPQAPSFSGTSILVDTNGSVLEEAQKGFDIEFGWEMGQHIDVIRAHTDSTHLYAGGYYFKGDNTEDVAGYKARLAVDVTSDIQLGGRFQRDDERGSQSFLEATIRFPFGQKKKFREDGLRARLDESPERDVDIITGSVEKEGGRAPVLNAQSGRAQQILHVNNTAAAGGDGSAERPFNVLSDAQAASAAQGIIYVHRGDGTSTGQNAGITLDKTGQQLIGSGVDFVYDSGRFKTSSGNVSSGLVIAKAGAAPVISNAAGSAISISADDISVSGVTVSGASEYGILVRADGAAASAKNVSISSVTAQNNKFGIFIHGANGGAVGAKVEKSVASSNTQHGIVVYDDTSGDFVADLGSGSLDSAGRNMLSGNTLEDLAVDYDGGTLSAMHNWWGQAGGADQDNPSNGKRPQIYYGAPINDGLLGHLTFDTEWMSNTIAYDRSASNISATLNGGMSLANQVTGQNRQALEFNGGANYVGLGTSATFVPSANAPISMYAVFSSDTFSGGQRIANIRMSSGNSAIFLATVAGPNSTAGFTQALTTVRYDDVTLTANTYYSAALTYNGTTLTGYNNGVADSDVRATTLSAGGSAFPAMIGTFSGAATNAFDGKIDDVRIYNRALTAAEVAQLHRMNTNSVVSVGSFLTSAP